MSRSCRRFRPRPPRRGNFRVGKPLRSGRLFVFAQAPSRFARRTRGDWPPHRHWDGTAEGVSSSNNWAFVTAMAPPHEIANAPLRRLRAHMWGESQLLAGVKAPRAGAELRDQKSSAQHGEILHEHHHLHLLHHGIGDCPEFVHGRDADQEDGNESAADLCFVTEQDRESA